MVGIYCANIAHRVKIELRIGHELMLFKMWYVGGYMKVLNLALLISTIGLVSCGSDSGSTQQTKVSGIFSDSAVTNFQQTSGIAKVDKSDKVLNFVLPTAYAGSGNISCLSGEAIGFSMDALGNSVNVSSTCSSVSVIDKDIRINLLKSMNGKKMRRTVTEADYNGDDAFLDFSGSFQFNVGYDVPRNAGLPCKETYTFKADGTVTVSALDQGGQTANGSACGGAYTDTISFQFANGYLEFDLSAQRNFSKTNTMADGLSQAASYERFEVCGGGNVISSDTLPTSIGTAGTNLSSVRNAVATAGNPVCN